VSKKKKKRIKNGAERKRKNKFRGFALPQEAKRIIFAVLMILAAVLVSLSFFEKAGKAGEFFMRSGRFLIGESIFLVPLIFLLIGLAFLNIKEERNFFKRENELFWLAVLVICMLVFGLSGILGTFSPQIKRGGWLGYVLNWPLLKYFSFLAARIIFIAMLTIGVLILWRILIPFRKKREIESGEEAGEEEPVLKKTSIIKRIFAPKFKVKEISQDENIERQTREEPALKLESKPISSNAKLFSYQPPPFKLLELERGLPTSGDTKANSAIIKKTLHDFGIEVVMSEVNIGPTVTQYTLKPAEGVKLSKITNLSNNLSLALASHPIRIEAPIPGRSLVGIEIPNKTRSNVRLRNLIENPNFQKSAAKLLIALGRDVSGIPIYADLTKMPHLLVAGSTGAGKTIFLNVLILSLLYQPNVFTRSASPKNLRFIFIDPKRVEFSIYNDLPHLLCPVIYNAAETVSALRWLTGEMERRFDVMSLVQAKNIESYNEKALKNKEEPLPFIVLIIDELADLMAAKGREIEAGIVRLAQMSRAVGIHLVVATQRPSVEVITGLIKANITSRVAFQVASQVDSRTILDVSGAEKLIGSGDMLYVSSQTPKPKRIQGAYVADKEVKNVVKYIVSENQTSDSLVEMDKGLSEELKSSQENLSKESAGFFDEQDPLYEEAKKLVFEAKKASASFLQRRLRIGYARAARLIDMMEEEGVVGPAEGAKPREVYGQSKAEERAEDDLSTNSNEKENNDGWEKV
jgi:S-DNA-T family DNA segregation ATPase FtsK/SpoIIIE